MRRPGATGGEVGVSFDGWEILERLEIPGGGLDLLARDPASGKEVRLWIGAKGRPGGGDPEPALEELRARLARVYHSGLPRVLKTGTFEGRPGLAVQAYRGRLLAEIADESPLGTLECLDVVRGIGAALVKAHAAGMVHGAVSEREILIAEDGRPLLLHLGFEPFLDPRPPRAPEDLERPGGSETADVYGLSRVLLRGVTGEDPWAADPAAPDPVEAARRGLARSVTLRADDFPAPLPEGLRRFLERAVRPALDGRIHRAEELTGDLGVIRASWDAMAVEKPPVVLPFPAFLRPRNLLVLLLAVVIVGILIARSCDSGVGSAGFPG
jgi:serine/threonine protein kinase